MSGFQFNINGDRVPATTDVKRNVIAACIRASTKTHGGYYCTPEEGLSIAEYYLGGFKPDEIITKLKEMHGTTRGRAFVDNKIRQAFEGIRLPAKRVHIHNRTNNYMGIPPVSYEKIMSTNHLEEKEQ